MQLKLLIELKSYRGIPPQSVIFINDKITTTKLSHGNNLVILDVTDKDTVSVHMSGKAPLDTELSNNQIVSDKAVVLKEIWLGQLDFSTHRKNLPYYDDLGNQIDSDNYMHSNGKLLISINELIHLCPGNLRELASQQLTFEQMVLEVMGRPTTISFEK